MRKLLISLVILILLVSGIIVVFNSSKNDAKKEYGKISVIATIYPIYDFAREIAGDKASVNMLLSPGVELHDYEPTPQDIIKIQEADLFLYLGEELEPWAHTVIAGMDKRDNLKEIARNIVLVESEEFEHGHDEHHEEHEKYDTHIWLDPTKAIKMVQNITDDFCERDPKNAEYYRERATEYIRKLSVLDRSFEETVKNGKRKEIAFGGPFSYGYFIKRYDLDYISAYDSCGEESEPSVNKVLEVVEKMKKDGLPVVFYKELSSGNIVRTIAYETGAEALEFNSLHSATREQIESGRTYLDIMEKNLMNLKRALGD